MLSQTECTVNRVGGKINVPYSCTILIDTPVDN